MRWTGLLATLAAMLAGAAAAEKKSPTTIDRICYSADVTTNCLCNEKFTELTLNKGDLNSIGVREKFSVRHCSKLHINKNSFQGMNDLKNLDINNVSEVFMKSGAFEHLQFLMVENVGSLNLNISSLLGANGISNIQIRNTTIPELPKWSLTDIEGLREFHLENVNISIIKKNSIMLKMNPSKSDVVLRNCKITEIEEGAIEIKSTINFIMDKCTVDKAAKDSIRIDHQNYANLTGNVFKKDVSVDAFNISGHNIVFKDNAVEAVVPRRSRLLHGFDNLIVQGTNNSVTCECPTEQNKMVGSEDHFKDNICFHGCSSATVSAFLESCAKDGFLDYQTRIKNLCHGEGHFQNPPTETEGEGVTYSTEETNKTDNPSTGRRISSAARSLKTEGLTVLLATVLYFFY